jgi:hypothetical protein
MPQVSTEERQKAKATAARAAVAANDVAVKLGITGAVAATALIVVGVAAPAGVAVGLALGVGSFVAWWIGNRYQELANDPPRDDFGTVTISQAAFTGAGLSTTDWVKAATGLATHQIILGDALGALITSIERCDGAIAAGDVSAAQAQIDAIQQNAAKAKAAQSLVLDFAAALNAAWRQAPADWSSVTVEQVKSNYLQAAGPPHQSPGQTLRSILDDITGLPDDTFGDLQAEHDPVLALSEVPERPDALIAPEFVNAMAELSTRFESLVDESNA